MATLAQQYAQPAIQQGSYLNQTPLPSEVWDYNKVWNSFRPNIQALAVQQVDPELNRQYKTNLRSLQGNLGSTGGYRFGSGMSQFGNLKASTERERSAQVGDWENMFQSSVYNPLYNYASTAWQQALGSGLKPSSAVKVPTWADLYDQYSQAFNVGDVVKSSSPFYS